MRRRRFIKAAPAIVAGFALPALPQDPPESKVSKEALDCAEKVAGLEFTDADEERALAAVNRNLGNYEQLRSLDIPSDTEPALVFRPYLPGKAPPRGATPNARIRMGARAPAARPSSADDLAFLPVTSLAALVRRRDVSSVELTKIYLERLEKYGPVLNCVVTLTKDLALAQAARADAEIRAGKYRGPLHGIPWGAKDLLATKGIPTTWGAAPFKDQVFDRDATVVERLREAGAVLVAKLSMGALAQGDMWFRGQTKTPWDTSRGSSGSSAGPGAATAAGLVGFAIGTETRGSIISPSAVNGVVGLRPTYGRVSRDGAMALSWTMDKIGPMCRSVEDCALVLNAIYGPDGRDETVVDAPFAWNPGLPVSKLRIGYIASEFEPRPDGGAGGRGRADAGGRANAGGRADAGARGSSDNQQAQAEARLRILNAALDVFRSLGATLHPIDIPAIRTAGTIGFILTVEAAAAFDDLTRSEEIRDPSLNAWPDAFRAHRFVPAVEYLRAQRARTLIMREMDALMMQYDVFLSPTNSGSLGLTNLTGHPALALRAGFHENVPVELMITGRLYDEATLLAAGLAYERATAWHLQRPPLAT